MSSPLKSDITISAEKFAPEAIPEYSLKANQTLVDTFAKMPNWWEIGVAKYRSMRENGETVLPVPPLLPGGQNLSIPSRDSSRTIPCRLFYPNDSKTASKGIIYHIHGGGWVLGNEKSQDALLKTYADGSGCAVISIGYRLAPEDPFPAGPEDCFDVAEYLVDKGEKEFGGPLSFVGGESAGGHLSMLVTFHLLRTRPTFSFLGLLLHYGCFDLTVPRSKTILPILTPGSYSAFDSAFLPSKTIAEKQDPSISPYFTDLSQYRGKLPSALFTCGTVDMLLDDTMLMSTKWLMHGGEAVTKVYTGAVHGFMNFPMGVFPQTKEGMDDTLKYINERLATIA